MRRREGSERAGPPTRLQVLVPNLEAAGVSEPPSRGRTPAMPLGLVPRVKSCGQGTEKPSSLV